MAAKEGVFKSQGGDEFPVLTLNPEAKFPFTVGVKKAEMILAHLPEIEAFVKKHKKVE
jgi:hypothetical protein